MAGVHKHELPIASRASDCPLLGTYLSLRPVKLERALSASLGGAPAFQIRTESDGMRLKHQPPWSLHALSNTANATSTVSFGQATASSNGVAGAIDPTNPLTTIHWG